MYSLNVVIVAFGAGGLILGGVVWLVMIIAQLRARLAGLEAKANQPAPPPPAARHWTESVPLDHRVQIASMGVLSKVVLRDILDLQMRMNSEDAREVVREVCPHWFKEIG